MAVKLLFNNTLYKLPTLTCYIRFHNIKNFILYENLPAKYLLPALTINKTSMAAFMTKERAGSET